MKKSDENMTKDVQHTHGETFVPEYPIRDLPSEMGQFAGSKVHELDELIQHVKSETGVSIGEGVCTFSRKILILASLVHFANSRLDNDVLSFSFGPKSDGGAYLILSVGIGSRLTFSLREDGAGATVFRSLDGLPVGEPDFISTMDSVKTHYTWLSCPVESI